MTDAEVYDTLDRLVDNLQKQIAMARELKRMFRIADIVGRAPSNIKGRVRTHIHSGGLALHTWKHDHFVVHLDGKEVFRAKLVDVHQDLWPDDVREAYARYARSLINHSF